MIVYGVPTMRILKYIAVFTPEPWQGYGYDEDSKAILKQGNIRGREITWGDTHHPALSETDGKYDGKWLVINDKANPKNCRNRFWQTLKPKQIVVNPVFKSEHGGSFFTPNSEYILRRVNMQPHMITTITQSRSIKETYRGGVTILEVQ